MKALRRTSNHVHELLTKSPCHVRLHMLRRREEEDNGRIPQRRRSKLPLERQIPTRNTYRQLRFCRNQLMDLVPQNPFVLSEFPFSPYSPASAPAVGLARETILLGPLELEQVSFC